MIVVSCDRRCYDTRGPRGRAASCAGAACMSCRRVSVCCIWLFCALAVRMHFLRAPHLPFRASNLCQRPWLSAHKRAAGASTSQPEDRRVAGAAGRRRRRNGGITRRCTAIPCSWSRRAAHRLRDANLSNTRGLRKLCTSAASVALCFFLRWNARCFWSTAAEKSASPVNTSDMSR